MTTEIRNAILNLEVYKNSVNKYREGGKVVGVLVTQKSAFKVAQTLKAEGLVTVKDVSFYEPTKFGGSGKKVERYLVKLV